MSILSKHIKTNRIIFIALIPVLLFTNCSERKTEMFILDPTETETRDINLSEMASDIWYIPLSNQVLFMSINSIEIKNSIIFVSTGSTLALYNLDGGFIGEINKAGRGPNEYIKLRDFTVDSENKLLYILDYSKVICYDYEGNFKNKFSVGHLTYGDILFQDNKLYLFGTLGPAADDMCLWSIFDITGNELTSKMDNLEYDPYSVEPMNGYYKYNNNICYWSVVYDTVFSIIEQGYEPRYLYKDGSYRPLRTTPREALAPIDLMETDRYIISQFFYQYNYNYEVIDKKNNKSIILTDVDGNSSKTFNNGGIDFNWYYFSNDLDNGLYFEPVKYVKIKSDEYLIGYVLPLNLKAHVATEVFKNSTPKYPEKKKQLEHLANSLDENDNTVLMLVKLKE